MSKLDIIRAWKDEEYCESLSLAERARVPQNPAGIIDPRQMLVAHRQVRSNLCGKHGRMSAIPDNAQ